MRLMSDIEKLQSQLFGARFSGATFAKFRFPPEIYDQANEWLKVPKKFMVMTGPPGVGKTYFCSALIAVGVRFPSFRAWNERDLLQKIRTGIGTQSGDYLQHLQTLVDDQLVIIDDLGASGRNDWREEILIELLDYRYKLDLPTVFTSNLSKDDFYRTYHARVGSRLFATQNVIIDMTGMIDQRRAGN